ncbi:MAG: peptidoglycan-binding domain-containing protein [Candidatus Gracilibacteria bacterium]
MDNLNQFKNIETKGIDDSASFSKLVKLSDSDSMRGQIAGDNNMSELVNTHFRESNEKVLSTYSKYGLNMNSLQQSLVDHNYDLGGYGKQKNGVDGYFGKYTFVALVNLQKALGQKPTGIVDLTLLKLLFPHTFRTLNKNEGRSEKETGEFVGERIKGYKEGLSEKKTLVIKATQKKLVRLNSELTNNTIADTNPGESKSHIVSVDLEKKGRTTYCSRTARKNLYRLGVPRNEVPVGPSAIASMRMYGRKSNYVNKISDLPSGTNVLDLFIDSRSKYEHRAAAYKNNGSWYVLDPYSKLKSNRTNPNLPIPLEEYVSSKKIMGVYPYTA